MSITRRTVLQKVRCRVIPFRACSSTACKHRVSGSLSLPSRGPFHLSITVLLAIGHQVVFRLGGWSPRLPARFPVSRGTLDPAASLPLSLTGLSPSLAGFPNTILLASVLLLQSSTPHNRSYPVWPLSLSLAATQKITLVFSSCGYLDVSVPHVPPTELWIHPAVTGLFPAGFPHSDIGGSPTVCVSPPLFAAYRVLLRLLVPRHPPYALLRLIPLSSSTLSGFRFLSSLKWFLLREFPLFFAGLSPASLFERFFLLSASQCAIFKVLSRFSSPASVP